MPRLMNAEAKPTARPAEQNSFPLVKVATFTRGAHEVGWVFQVWNALGRTEADETK